MSELIEVTVPNDCYPGDSFLVEWAGESLTVVVPEDGYGGMTLAVEVGGGDGIEATSEVEVVVPDGCYPGDEFTVEYGESAFIVSVPDGSAPGDSIITAPTHPIGSTMEVLRSDGLWSLCTIKDYEWRGVTYTVQLTDLRLKYFVEEDDLRHPAESFSPQHSPGSIRPKKDRR